MVRFEDIGDVSFMGDITLDGIKTTLIDEYKAAYKEITGETPIVPDEDKAAMYAEAQTLYQLMATIDDKAKQNLLKYARGKYLDNLALRYGLTRKKEEKAAVMIRFTLSAPRENVVAIPAGTRVTGAAGKIYFATDEYAEILPGEKSVDVKCVSTSGGSVVNNFAVGELNYLVDPIAYIAKVENIDVPIGGEDKEDDQTFAERVFAARNEYSTTGAEEAYKYYTKSYSTAIDDVVVRNPSHAEIYIYILMKDREQATAGFMEGLLDYITKPQIKAMTDHVTIYNVERVNYEIDVKYYIYDTDIAKVSEIQAAVNTAIEAYKAWQCEKIGRDINDQRLISLLNAVGASRVEINKPTMTVIPANKIAHCTDVNITYGGIIEE
ncbi:phage tail protein [Lachnospiraceae bacterium MD329]|nr:phage tail protein [Lachnospiraceae bacterium MD329]